jgi:trk system potassium uptake protein TrkH
MVFSESVLPFFLSGLVALIPGIALYFLTKKRPRTQNLTRKEAYLIVSLSWFSISLAGSLPYLFSGAIPSFTNALFESVSGFTTTGSSILTDIEILPKSILFWRSLTHWIGGIGIIVLVIIVMPTLRIGGYHLFTMESSLQDKIQPKIKAVGTRLLFIYVFLTLAEIVFLMLGKMSVFESVCHAFATISTGGFSPKNSSIAAYSPYIQYVVMIFMLLAGMNFIVHYHLLKRKFARIRKNEELRFYVGMILFVGGIITASLVYDMGKSMEESFRLAYFQAISIITCTGFATTDYLLWPGYAWIILFFAMFLGGSTGSTSGGIKMARHLVLLKNFGRIFRKLSAPNAVFPIRLNDRPLKEETNSSILTYISVYLLVWLAGSFVLQGMGIDGKTASSAVATCMAGIGPGIGTIGPVANFAHLPDLAKGILSFLMILGRLEIYTIMILFTRNFWMK